MRSDVMLAATDELPREFLRELLPFLQTAYEGAFDAHDWAHALGGRHAWAYDAQGLVAHGSVVPRTFWCAGHVLQAGYVESVATRPDARRRGHGTSVMRVLQSLIRARFAMGALHAPCTECYEALGWERWLGPSWTARREDFAARDAWSRTEAYDDGVHFLRTPRTPDLDPHGAIVCEWREGKPW